MMSAACRMSASVTLRPNQFQEFQPMGGVAARGGVFESAVAPRTPDISSVKTESARRKFCIALLLAGENRFSNPIVWFHDPNGARYGFLSSWWRRTREGN